MTPIVRLLLLANVVVFGLQNLADDELFRHFALWPLGRHYVSGLGFVGFEPWQLVTSAFLHGGFAHIALNMYALYMFGGMVERVLGSRRFAWLYFASVLAAAVVQLIVVTATLASGAAPTVGASGGVFGVLLAFALLFPHSRVYIIPIPFALKAWVMVTGYAIVELASGVFGTTQGVAHFAHLGGMLGAGIVMLAIGYRSRVQPGGNLRGP
ncbi:MAG TPA: rhomboid family intramembrane serine protease [Steroidobacteraceae bacterium]|jgi:membrane associated rhomboid family serine protease|nr:rhomboid family intramembrane serine protease [Steroidobacteraceae bacterium]